MERCIACHLSYVTRMKTHLIQDKHGQTHIMSYDLWLMNVDYMIWNMYQKSYPHNYHSDSFEKTPTFFFVSAPRAQGPHRSPPGSPDAWSHDRDGRRCRSATSCAPWWSRSSPASGWSCSPSARSSSSCLEKEKTSVIWMGRRANGFFVQPTTNIFLCVSGIEYHEWKFLAWATTDTIWASKN